MQIGTSGPWESGSQRSMSHEAKVALNQTAEDRVRSYDASAVAFD